MANLFRSEVGTHLHAPNDLHGPMRVVAIIGMRVRELYPQFKTFWRFFDPLLQEFDRSAEIAVAEQGIHVVFWDWHRAGFGRTLRDQARFDGFLFARRLAADARRA